MNTLPSHVGDLKPIVDDGAGNATYWAKAYRPTLFWSKNNVSKRSMVVYERPDDYGQGNTDESIWNGSMGREIACCNVTPFRVVYDVDYEVAGRGLDEFDDEGIEVMTEDEFRQLFGFDFDPNEWTDEAFLDQN